MGRVVVLEQHGGGRVGALLAGEGFDVDVIADSFDVVIPEITRADPDLVVYEVMTLGPPVLSVCEQVVGATSVPLAVLCESSTENDVLDGYAAGAAAILSEPIGPRELVARLRALLRRGSIAERVEPDDDVLRVGPIVLDRACRSVTVRGVAMALPRREFDIAEVLMRRAGVVVTRRQLLNELWGGSARDSKSLDVQVGRLRARLAALEGYRRIVTVRSVGYRMVTDEDLRLARTRAADESSLSY